MPGAGLVHTDRSILTTWEVSYFQQLIPYKSLEGMPYSIRNLCNAGAQIPGNNGLSSRIDR